MQIKIEQAFKLSLIALLTALASFCVVSKATSEWKDTNLLAVVSDARHFSQFFHVKPFVHYLLLIAIAVFLGVSASRPLLSYLRRLLNSLVLMRNIPGT